MSVTEARAHFVCGTPQLTVWDFACARTTRRTSTVWNVSCSVRTPLSSCHSQNLRKTKIADPRPKKGKKKKKKEFSRYKSKTEKDQRSKVCGMFSTTRKRDNEFVVKELDFCHLASLYYIKVVNRIIKRATFFLYVRRPVLRPSSTTILAVTLCLCAMYVDQVFLFFSLVATISSRENSNSFLW